MKKKKQTTDFFKTITDESIVAIIAFDPNGQCTYINQVAKDLLEVSLDADQLTFHVKNLYPKKIAEHRIKTLNDELLQLEGLLQDILIQKLNGQNFIANLGLKKVAHNKKSYQLVMIQDVTMQKKMQREITEKQSAISQAYQDLLAQNKQLLELDQAKNRFIAITTHELRTPLSAMYSSAEILKMKLYDTEKEHDEFVDMIYDQGQHLLNLVNDILDLAKLQSDKMDYYVSEQAVDTLIKHEVASLIPMAEAASVQLTCDLGVETFKAYFDEVRLRQVLTNLINNAIKYNKKHGSVTVSLYESAKEIFIHIKDTGRGISSEDQKKIFNEFETLGKISNHAKGTGLGLSISQRMMKAMGGDITLQSEIGVGSTFTVVIPKTRVLGEEFYRQRPNSDGSGDIAA